MKRTTFAATLLSLAVPAFHIFPTKSQKMVTSLPIKSMRRTSIYKRLRSKTTLR